MEFLPSLFRHKFIKIIYLNILVRVRILLKCISVYYDLGVVFFCLFIDFFLSLDFLIISFVSNSTSIQSRIQYLMYKYSNEWYDGMDILWHRIRHMESVRIKMEAFNTIIISMSNHFINDIINNQYWHFISFHSYMIWKQNKWIFLCVFFFYSRLNSRLYLSLLMYHFIKHLNHFIYCRKSFKKMSNWTETAKNLELNREISSNSTFLLRISDPGDNLIFCKGSGENHWPDKKNIPDSWKILFVFPRSPQREHFTCPFISTDWTMDFIIEWCVFKSSIDSRKNVPLQASIKHFY